MGGVRIVTTLILALAILPAAVTPATAGCVASLVQAADRHGVPPDLMLALGHAETGLEITIGFFGVLLGAMNAVGGYVVTERMLEMLKKKKNK